ncbi:MAG: ribonuclease H family protein [Anaerolineales bacterium]|nr:ribonuclease H family protein [Anaerolineales bacterium]
MASKAKFYVVWKGRRTGIFDSWEACQTQVTGFPGAEYKSFPSREAAERAWRGNYQDYAGRPASSGQWLFAPNPPIAESICVDAACSGSPGPLEYRGVRTSTGQEIFRQGPYPSGTNNVGEFLALVHALAWLQEQGLDLPVYSDSGTALAWVRGKKCKTELIPDESNTILFELIARAEAWLEANEIVKPVLKWDTQAWGEIPADFNRK